MRYKFLNHARVKLIPSDCCLRKHESMQVNRFTFDGVIGQSWRELAILCWKMKSPEEKIVHWDVTGRLVISLWMFVSHDVRMNSCLAMIDFRYMNTSLKSFRIHVYRLFEYRCMCDSTAKQSTRFHEMAMRTFIVWRLSHDDPANYLVKKRIGISPISLQLIANCCDSINSELCIETALPREANATVNR